MIEFSHAYKVYSGTTSPIHALKDINLRIEKGEFVFLTGPSGAGKTTLFKLLSAYDRPTSGKICVSGFDVNQMTSQQIPYFRRHLGVVYQDFRLLRQRTVFENVALPLEIRRERSRYIKARVEEVLEQVSLFHKRNEYPNQLSGGEQQRASIARALIHHPNVLLADEPTGNLDPELAREIVAIFDKINAQGTTVFIATHDHELVKSRSRRTIELKDGAIV